MMILNCETNFLISLNTMYKASIESQRNSLILLTNDHTDLNMEISIQQFIDQLPQLYRIKNLYNDIRKMIITVQKNFTQPYRIFKLQVMRIYLWFVLIESN